MAGVPDLSISKIGPEFDVALRDLFQHYMRDMSEWFEANACDASAILEKGYDAYLAKVGDSPAGFALVGSAGEWAGGMSAYDVHEFFVLREFRRRGVGHSMAALIWDERPGPWLVRVLEANGPAVLFWRNAISRQ